MMCCSTIKRHVQSRVECSRSALPQPPVAPLVEQEVQDTDNYAINFESKRFLYCLIVSISKLSNWNDPFSKLLPKTILTENCDDGVQPGNFKGGGAGLFVIGSI